MEKSLVTEAADFLRSRGFEKPIAGIVLGTGLNALIAKIEIANTVPYTDIPHFPVSTVEFHKGRLIYGRIGGVTVAVMQGRFHHYEGYSMQQITFPIRVLKELGIETLILSNAAGGLNPDHKKGDLVIVGDHINLLPENPLRGLRPDWGNRFVDMSEPYDPVLRQGLAAAFEKEGLAATQGIYVAVAGPNLETKAEYRWLRGMGADMVGMSTVPEVIVAAQSGLRCVAVSVITDECDPDNLKPINIAEIIETAGRADQKLTDIFCSFICSLQIL